MTQDYNLVVLIPAYNEELTIGSMVVLSKPYASRVVVVEDGSKDRTSMIASVSGAEVVRMAMNSGKAQALQEGFDYIKQYDPDIVVIMDGDGQMDPFQIRSIAQPIIDGEADLVIGSRYLKVGEKIPFKRKIGQRYSTPPPTWARSSS